MIRIVTFGNEKVWLFIQELHQHNDKNKDLKNLVPSSKFLCYFKFTEPSVVVYGELIRDAETSIPLVFNSADEAEKFTFNYLRKRFNFK
jgi:hypothetical protein